MNPRERNNEAEKDEVEKIKEEIEKSGFPLEIEVSKVLKRHEWRVLNQQYYFDRDERKGRTIDVMAYVAEHSEIGDYKPFHVSLIIECKSSSTPWVFWTTQKDKKLFSFPFMLVKHWARPRGITPGRKRYDDWLKWMPYSHIYSPNLDRVALIHYEPFKKGKGRKIFEASNQVMKALSFELMRHKKLALLMPNLHALFILYPVIVFDGRLFELRVENGDLKVLPVEYLQYWTSTLREDFLIDVIKKEFLSTYLEELKAEINKMKVELEKQASPINHSPRDVHDDKTSIF